MLPATHLAVLADLVDARIVALGPPTNDVAAERELLGQVRQAIHVARFKAEAQARFAMASRPLFTVDANGVIRAGDAANLNLWRPPHAKTRAFASGLARACEAGKPMPVAIGSRSGAYGVLKTLAQGIREHVCPQVAATLTRVTFYDEGGMVYAELRERET